MSKKIKLTGCSQLDFDDHYTAQKVLFSGNKVCWERVQLDSDMPKLVQFCKLRGRLNSPEACLSKDMARCSYYEEIEHLVEIVNEEKMTKEAKRTKAYATIQTDSGKRRQRAEDILFRRIQERDRKTEALRILYTEIPWEKLSKEQEEILWQFFAREW